MQPATGKEQEVATESDTRHCGSDHSAASWEGEVPRAAPRTDLKSQKITDVKLSSHTPSAYIHSANIYWPPTVAKHCVNWWVRWR